jgi:hypothetical protein
MNLVMTFDLQHAMGDIISRNFSRSRPTARVPRPTVPRPEWIWPWPLTSWWHYKQNGHIFNYTTISHERNEGLIHCILVLMLKNIFYLANFCSHLESLEVKVLEMGANHLMTASHDFPLSLSRNSQKCTDSLCPVTHCAPWPTVPRNPLCPVFPYGQGKMVDCEPQPTRTRPTSNMEFTIEIDLHAAVPMQ